MCEGEFPLDRAFGEVYLNLDVEDEELLRRIDELFLPAA